MFQRVVQLKIILQNTNPEIWRRVQIMEGSSLRTLQSLIQDVFWWQRCHSYMFKIGENEYSDTEYDVGQGRFDDSRFKVGKIVDQFSEFEFIYDFGDWWSHKVVFEGFLLADAEEKYPVCIAGKNAGPPEDVGGPPGFEEFKAAIADKPHERHQELLDWYDGGFFQKNFRVDWFDVKMTNIKIRRREKPRLISNLKIKAAPKEKRPLLSIVK